jgi:RNA polymerase subunit RPABC4/transcription elongation factor Spt4
MNCLNCNAQIASTEIYCPFCGEVNERAGKPGVPQPTVSINEVRCLFCTAMVPQGARFCGACGREQTLRPQSNGGAKAGKAIGWTCGGCLGLIVLVSLVSGLANFLF